MDPHRNQADRPDKLNRLFRGSKNVINAKASDTTLLRYSVNSPSFDHVHGKVGVPLLFVRLDCVRETEPG